MLITRRGCRWCSLLYIYIYIRCRRKSRVPESAENKLVDRVKLKYNFVCKVYVEIILYYIGLNNSILYIAHSSGLSACRRHHHHRVTVYKDGKLLVYGSAQRFPCLFTDKKCHTKAECLGCIDPYLESDFCVKVSGVYVYKTSDVAFNAYPAF